MQELWVSHPIGQSDGDVSVPYSLKYDQENEQSSINFGMPYFVVIISFKCFIVSFVYFLSLELASYMEKSIFFRQLGRKFQVENRTEL